MGMGVICKVAMELQQLGYFDNVESVMDMGAQEVHVEFEKFKYWVKQTNLKFNENIFSDLKHYPAHPRVPTKEFWKMLGFKNVVCLDIAKQHDSIYCDLNYSFDDKAHIGKYDLVTDFGNNEHPFNIVEAYRTMHKLCKKNGYMIIEQAVFSGNGYYNLDIPFFEGLAVANNYSVIYSAYNIVTNNGEYHLPCDNQILKILLNSNIRTGISYIFKKNDDNEFKYCYQGTVEKSFTSIYRTQFITDIFPPERMYIPTVKTVGVRQALKIIISKLFSKFNKT